ncbi:MAG: helix-turn-helix domain-containing protein, partial [Nitrospiraceae bacterium]|nr:helix-turn-helix domain-containing protein [Nitrospiraceae bacterium]
ILFINANIRSSVYIDFIRYGVYFILIRSSVYSVEFYWRVIMNQIARTPKQIGEVMRRERRRKGLTQEDLGNKTVLRQGTISAVESGEPRTQISTICDIMTALGLEFVIRSRSEGETKNIEDIF